MAIRFDSIRLLWTIIGVSTCNESSCLGNPANFQGCINYRSPPWSQKLAPKRLGVLVFELYVAAMTRPDMSFHINMHLRHMVPWGCPLFIATYSGDVEALKCIIRGGVGLNDQTNDFGTTALAVSVSD